MASWSYLPCDLLILIARRLRLFEDFVSFGCVCQSWLMVANKQDFSKLVQIPWLMLPNDHQTTILRDFYSLANDRIYSVKLPEANRKKCFFSLGWLFTIGKDEELNLLHPLSRSQIRLPNLSNFLPDLEYEGVEDMESIFIDKVVLSVDPRSSSDYAVMVLCGAATRLAFYKAGDHGWTVIDTYMVTYHDVIRYKGKFYAVDCRGRVFVCDVNGPNPTIIEMVVIVGPLNVFGHSQRFYLVESLSGKLLIVSREETELCYMVEDNDEEEEKTELMYGSRTTFEVFEVNESYGSWEEVKSIGDEALFLGDNSSFSIDVSSLNFNGVRANCIYFTNHRRETYHSMGWVPNGRGKDTGVYNLVDESFEPYFKGQSHSVDTPLLWVVPTF